MSLPLALLLLAYIAIHTMSYAVWNWKHNNKPGAIVVILVCLVTIALPAYVYFFRT